MATTRDRRRKPSHPGAMLREDLSPGLRLPRVRLQHAVDLGRVAQDRSVLAGIKPLPKDRIAA